MPSTMVLPQQRLPSLKFVRKLLLSKHLISNFPPFIVCENNDREDASSHHIINMQDNKKCTNKNINERYYYYDDSEDDIMSTSESSTTHKGSDSSRGDCTFLGSSSAGGSLLSLRMINHDAEDAKKIPPLVAAVAEKKRKQAASTSKKNKQVTFIKQPLVHYIPRASEYSLEEKSCLYYSSEEYMSFAESVKKEVGKLECGKRLKDRKYCARGLENYTNQAKQERHLNIHIRVQDILLEQDELELKARKNKDKSLDKSIRMYHEEHLAKVSQSITKVSKEIARHRGNQDELYVYQKVYKKIQSLR